MSTHLVHLAKTALPALAAAALLGGAALAAEQHSSPSTPEPSKEMRENMATVHERMAACLRSDKTFTECRGEMQQHCQGMMGEQGCMMMGVGKRQGMMNPPPSSKDPSSKDWR